MSSNVNERRGWEVLVADLGDLERDQESEEQSVGNCRVGGSRACAVNRRGDSAGPKDATSAYGQRRPTGMRSLLPLRLHHAEPFCHGWSRDPCDARSSGWWAYSGGPPLADW